MSKIGPWKSGCFRSVVISAEPCAACHQDTNSGHGDVSYYGGYLVAESVPPELAPLIVAAPDLLEKLKKLVSDLDDLISDSQGVSGLHHNGDLAPWDELTRGGRFEGWLSSLEDAREAIAKAEEARP